MLDPMKICVLGLSVVVFAAGAYGQCVTGTSYTDFSDGTMGDWALNSDRGESSVESGELVAYTGDDNFVDMFEFAQGDATGDFEFELTVDLASFDAVSPGDWSQMGLATWDGTYGYRAWGVCRDDVSGSITGVPNQWAVMAWNTYAWNWSSPNGWQHLVAPGGTQEVTVKLQRVGSTLSYLADVGAGMQLVGTEEGVTAALRLVAPFGFAQGQSGYVPVYLDDFRVSGDGVCDYPVTEPIPSTPLAGGLGLALMAGALVAGFGVVERKKRR